MGIQALIQKTIDAAGDAAEGAVEIANAAADMACAAVIEAGGSPEQAEKIQKEIYDRIL
jgi:hypothetical protein